GYVDVSTRLRLALAKFPDLRVSESLPVVVNAGESMFVQVTSTVWRSPDDPMPCSASAWERTPGRSNFTRDSEMMNASTSALGRALGLMGFGIVASMASEDEVQLRIQDRSGGAHTSREAGTRAPLYVEPDPAGELDRPTTTSTDDASAKQLGWLRGLMRARGVDDWRPPDGMTKAEASQLIMELKAEGE
ncbi:hypothetical protein UFOVP1266_22, partial [uncultured Caudovirales phage]